MTFGFSTSSVLGQSPADVNHKQQVDAIDLGKVLGVWATDGSTIRTDINNDGDIDGADLSILSSILNGILGGCPKASPDAGPNTITFTRYNGQNGHVIAVSPKSYGDVQVTTAACVQAHIVTAAEGSLCRLLVCPPCNYKEPCHNLYLAITWNSATFLAYSLTYFSTFKKPCQNLLSAIINRAP